MRSNGPLPPSELERRLEVAWLIRAQQGLANYESKFILDLFLFRASPARFLRHLAANVDFYPPLQAL
jgi:hypothetical protein